MVKKSGGESLSIDVYARLRIDIFNRRFAPGERLKPSELGARFGVSISVIREALGLLAAQNLVRIERNRSFHVTTLSPEAMHELAVARKINEGAALRMSVERGDVNWESEVLAAHHRMASEPMYLPDDPTVRNNDWAAAHIAFHYKLIEACGNAVLLDICVRLTDAGELYRAWSSANGDPHRDVAAEHRALLEAALDHDADRAVQLFGAHVDRTAQILMVLEQTSAAESSRDAATTP
ncbi:GntR family transcriptional regulator [Streptomyces sp. NBC_00878]|uniref:GntR family transcriptional regulator n=1 Tax=Streptomyces sp. NBC_00878 TaxID=2975854 RepID=UPI00224E61A9|nr:GntR family transcriptional regulator [Streptomyces sp. NBC_00878]MCX4903827.1 GntR family transcriptional regulator [Streptomyces sp. NBC_00878]